MRFVAISMLAICGLFSCKDPVEETCLKICDRVIQCAAKDHATNIQNQIRISCIDGCAIHQSDILECYSDDADCEELGECMFNSIMSQY
ncbi:MAG: Cys-rich protein [Leptonema sp. (in: Bacteria)]|nr:Cys-rich protein [Leptonema sp. (in: bacteria)]